MPQQDDIYGVTSPGETQLVSSSDGNSKLVTKTGRPRRVAPCHPDRLHYGKGLCKSCYRKQAKVSVPKTHSCSCGKLSKTGSRTCSACYMRKRRENAGRTGFATMCPHRIRPHWKAGHCRECYEKRQEEKRGKYNSDEGLRRYLKKTYGITPEDYARMFLEQGGKCAICKVDGKIDGGHLERLHIDHDHKTKVVRGLLCNNCNRGIGCFKEVPDSLLSAAEYLKRHGK